MLVFSEKNSARREIVSFLGALSLFLSAIEYIIPKPMPFFRLGLANLPLLLGLRFLRPADLLLLLTLKVLGQGLINGTLASYVFLFSLTGSLSSLVFMFLIYHVGGNRVSLIGVSLAGAMASSLAQLILSISFIFGDQAWVIAPFSLGSSLITGLIIGIFALRFCHSSKWLSCLEKRYKESIR